MYLTSLLTAAAAGLAAVLAALNLYISGRRERHRWIRETLVEAYVTYLKTSFNTSQKTQAWRGAAVSNADRDQLVTVRDEIKDLHELQMDTLTRLRLLAPLEVVQAAARVHVADHNIVNLAFDSEIQASKLQIEEARQNGHRQRQALIRAARKSMKVSGAASDVGEVTRNAISPPL
jgi:hypothetical protein